ncbi:hypothetical protein DH2020_046398 [Rehmannia glutinosa]|uniref:Fatty acyl-CoA reductase n=1 Tax=Rehmannia glutinosa TaxID=99300 RepID=A0ABR0UC10_REHGL
MELGSILHFLENRSILVTVFAEKILRVQPEIKKLYLLLRAPDTNTAMLRFNNEVIAKDLFEVVKEKCGGNFSSFLSEKVRVVAGDITCENLGVKELGLLKEMWEEVDVVVNLAATTNFDERYDVSLGINTMGARHVFNFSKNCTKLKVLVHVSTAYVSGEKEGLILETPYKMGETLNGTSGLDIDAEKMLVDETLKHLKSQNYSEDSIKSAMKDLGIQRFRSRLAWSVRLGDLRARKYGWQNTYVFTKAMGEMVLGHLKENMPLVIIRPTIVTSTYKEPFPGWVEGVRTIDSLAVGYGKGRITCFVGDPKNIIDVVSYLLPFNELSMFWVGLGRPDPSPTSQVKKSAQPKSLSGCSGFGSFVLGQSSPDLLGAAKNEVPADMVVNAMIVAMVAHANHPNNETNIYHIGSSVSNPVEFTWLQDYALRHFTKNPWINKDGKPIIVGKVTVLSTMDSFQRYMTIRYILPLKKLYLEQCRKIKFVMRLIDLYGPYLFFKGYYDDMNSEKLRRAAIESGIETEMFNFDPKTINWEDYFMNTHIPGIVKYVRSSEVYRRQLNT